MASSWKAAEQVECAKHADSGGSKFFVGNRSILRQPDQAVFQAADAARPESRESK